MQWDDLLATADDLIAGRGRNRKPRQANLRRAVSTAYYAMFHCLAQCCADTLVGSAGSNRSKHAWRQVYRAVEHKGTSKKCKRGEIHEFPKEVEDFANVFVSLQEKRHSADYDPFSQVLQTGRDGRHFYCEKCDQTFSLSPYQGSPSICGVYSFHHTN